MADGKRKASGEITESSGWVVSEETEEDSSQDESLPVFRTYSIGSRKFVGDSDLSSRSISRKRSNDLNEAENDADFQVSDRKLARMDSQLPGSSLVKIDGETPKPEMPRLEEIVEVTRELTCPGEGEARQRYQDGDFEVPEDFGEAYGELTCCEEVDQLRQRTETVQLMLTVLDQLLTKLLWARNRGTLENRYWNGLRFARAREMQLLQAQEAQAQVERTRALDHDRSAMSKIEAERLLRVRDEMPVLHLANSDPPPSQDDTLSPSKIKVAKEAVLPRGAPVPPPRKDHLPPAADIMDRYQAALSNIEEERLLQVRDEMPALSLTRSDPPPSQVETFAPRKITLRKEADLPLAISVTPPRFDRLSFAENAARAMETVVDNELIGELTKLLLSIPGKNFKLSQLREDPNSIFKSFSDDSISEALDALIRDGLVSKGDGDDYSKTSPELLTPEELLPYDLPWKSYISAYFNI